MTVRRYGDNPSRFPGRLFVVEGIDGSGKSTQLGLLAQWLRGSGRLVVHSEGNSSPIVRETTRRGKRKRILTPRSFSLIHATDFSDRVEREILPALKAGAIVLADRYVYTAFARDVTRGVDSHWVRALYRFAITPAVTFYFRTPIDVALNRILVNRPKLKWYEAGLDLALHPDPVESYKLFQTRILLEYEKLVDEFDLWVVDATQPIEVQQRALRRAVAQFLPPESTASAGRSVATERTAS